MVDFKYYNANPNNEIKGDCVTRAISYASGYSYNDILNKLKAVGKLLECDYKCVTCYDFLLTKYFNYRKMSCNDIPLYRFAENHKTGLYLVRSNGHISVLDNYCVIDTWDCRDMILTNAWRIL